MASASYLMTAIKASSLRLILYMNIWWIMFAIIIRSLNWAIHFTIFGRIGR